MNWAVIIAALVTLIGGVFVYRWQKETDRLAELAKERRETYRDFIEAIDVYMLVFFNGELEAKRQAFSRYRVAKRKVFLIGSSWVLSAINAHANALNECEQVMTGARMGVAEELNDAIVKAEDEIIVQMRNDFAYGVGVGLANIVPLRREIRK